MSKIHVDIYGMEGCGFCNAAISLAEELELDYTYHEDTPEFSTLFPQARTVPQIMIDGTWIGGYRDFEEVMESYE